MPELNEAQALNWAKVASAVARKSASRELQEDLVQSALLAILEDPSDDLLDKAWAVRGGIRNPLRRIARDRATEDASTHPEGDDPWLGHDTPHPAWPQMLDEEDRLTQRIREAYVEQAFRGRDPDASICPADGDIWVEAQAKADEAVKASSGTGYWGIEDEARMVDEPQPDPRWQPPIYMRPEHRLDWDEVEISAARFDPGWIDENTHWADYVYHGEEKEVMTYLGTLGTDAMRFARTEGLSPVEAAVLANRVARMVCDEAPRGKEGLYYSAVRNGAGDLMAACEGKSRVCLRAESDYEHADGKGTGTELPTPCPGATSNYAIEDEEVWMQLFPDGPGNERYELPKGDDRDIERLVGAVGARVEPEDVTYKQSPFIGEEDEYLGWQLWDTKVARQAHVRACLYRNDWDECALAGRKAFWAHKDHNHMLYRNYQALHAEGLDRDDSYKVCWASDKGPGHTPSEPSTQYTEPDEEYWTFIMS